MKSARSISLIVVIMHLLLLGGNPVRAAEEKNFGIEFVSSFGGETVGWVKAGNALYLAQSNVLRVLDVTDIQHPMERGRLVLDKIIESMEVKWPALYLGTCEFEAYSGDFELIDLSDPWLPKIADSRDVYIGWTKQTYIELTGNVLTVRNIDYDITNPLRPRKIGFADDYSTISQKLKRNRSQIKSVMTSKVANADKAMTAVLRPWQGLGTACDLQVRHNRAYVLDWEKGLRIVDISNLEKPKAVGSHPLNGHFLRLALVDNLILVTADDGNLYAIDISKEKAPKLRSRLKLPGPGYGIHVQGKRTYVATGDTGLQIVNISNPDKMSILGQYKTWCYDVHVTGTQAFLSTQGLMVIDVADPRSPKRIGAFSDKNVNSWDIENLWGIDVFGGDSNFGRIGQQLITMGPMSEHEAKDYTFGQIKFYDIAKPDSPVLKKSWGALDTDITHSEQLQFSGVKLHDDLMFTHWRYSSTGNGTNVLTVYPMRETDKKIAEYDKFHTLQALVIRDGYLYVADGPGGLVILRYVGFGGRK